MNTPASNLQLAARKSIGLSGLVAAVFGFLADVLQPIAPFAFYIFIAAAIIAAASLFIVLKSKAARAATLCVFSSMAAAFTGLICLFHNGEESKDKGIFATILPQLEYMQAKMGIIEKDVAEIKTDVKDIKNTTDQTAQNTETIIAGQNLTDSKIDHQSSKIDAQTETLNSHSGKLDDIKKGIDANAKLGGIIPNPSTPEENYHNAKIHELAGDYGNARRSYLAYFQSGQNKLDPHLRFIDFLKIQEGSAGAREGYALATRNTKDTLIQSYAPITLLPNKTTRIEKLNAFTTEHPDFGPAHYHLSREYSLDKLGEQSLDDKRQELTHLNAYQKAYDDGQVTKYFIDKDLLTAWNNDVATRIKTANSAANKAALQNPVTISWMSSNSGWMGNIQIAEATTEIQWRIKDLGDFKPTGSLPNNDPRTGKPMANPTITLPLKSPAQEIEVRYKNLTGTISPPSTHKFQPKQADLTQAKHILNLTKQSWISFRDYDGKTLAYFSHLIANRGSLEKITYAIDKDIPDTDYPFLPFDGAGIAPIDSKSKIMLEIPKDTKFITAQVTFKDGTKSEIIKIER